MPRSFSSRRSVRSTRKAPVRRARVASPQPEPPLALPSFTDVLFQQGLVSPDHKRGLILAHAHARRTRPKVHRLVYLSSVALCFGIILAGWWFTVGYQMRSQMRFVNTSVIRQQIGIESNRLEQAYLGKQPSVQDSDVSK